MSLIRMERVGIVRTSQNGPFQCKNMGHDTYGYSVRITCPHYSRDKYGFIIDNQLIQGAVQEIFNSPRGAESCEILVCCIGEALKLLVEDNGVEVVDLYAKIWPVTGSQGVDPNTITSFEYSTSGKF